MLSLRLNRGTRGWNVWWMTISSGGGWMPPSACVGMHACIPVTSWTSTPVVACAVKGHTHANRTTSATRAAREARACDVMNCCGGGVVVAGSALGQASDRNGGAGVEVASGDVHVHWRTQAASLSKFPLKNIILFHIACKQLNILAAEHCSNGIFKAVDMLQQYFFQCSLQLRLRLELNFRKLSLFPQNFVGGGPRNLKECRWTFYSQITILMLANEMNLAIIFVEIII